EVLPSSDVINTRGTKRITGVTVNTPQGKRQIDCDLLCVSGGWTPTLHLYAQSGIKPRYDERWGAFVPGETISGLTCAGTCNGTQGLQQIMTEGWQAGRRVAGADPAADDTV